MDKKPRYEVVRGWNNEWWVQDNLTNKLTPDIVDNPDIEQGKREIEEIVNKLNNGEINHERKI